MVNQVSHGGVLHDLFDFEDDGSCYGNDCTPATGRLIVSHVNDVGVHAALTEDMRPSRGISIKDKCNGVLINVVHDQSG